MLQSHVEFGIEKARDIARKEGLNVGDTVIFRQDKTVYALKEIKGPIAVVWVPGSEETTKEYPLNELFDPNVAQKIMIEFQRSQLGPILSGIVELGGLNNDSNRNGDK